jgi:hypothetical protein
MRNERAHRERRGDDDMGREREELSYDALDDLINDVEPNPSTLLYFPPD